MNLVLDVFWCTIGVVYAIRSHWWTTIFFVSITTSLQWNDRCCVSWYTCSKVCRQRTVLAAVCFVYDNGKTLVLQWTSNLIEDERELEDGADDDLLTASQQLTQRPRIVCPSYEVAQSLEGIDIVAYLFVEVHTVGHHDDAVKEWLLIGLEQGDKLIGKPSNRVRLAAACTMLNEEPSADGWHPCDM